jgi:hypothetical protein|eukprot:COSAG06_NODE_11309_length_1530_cov_195.642208_1_plen_216_part_00
MLHSRRTRRPTRAFGTRTGPTLMSSPVYTDEWRNLNLRPRPWPSTNDLLEQIEDLLEHFGIDDNWGPLCFGGGTRRGSPLMWPSVVMRTSERGGWQDGIDVYRSELERLVKFLKQLKRSKAVTMVDAQRIMGLGDRTLKELKRVLICHHQLVGKGLRAQCSRIITATADTSVVEAETAAVIATQAPPRQSPRQSPWQSPRRRSQTAKGLVKRQKV